MRAYLLVTISLVIAGCDGGSPPMTTTDGGMQVDGSMLETDGGMLVGTHPTGPHVVPTCTDGRYAEELPNRSALITDLTLTYSPSNVEGFIEDVLARRYPTGRQLVIEGNASSQLPAGETCASLFLSDTSSANSVIQQLDTVVHECGHMADGESSHSPDNVYIVTTALELTASRGDTTTRNGLTFARSRILDDSYQPLRMPCPSGTFDSSCDGYAGTYLDGDPDDTTFMGGDQGFNMLFEELVQYVNSLATAYAFQESFTAGGRRTSARDGLLTFLWYVERYLHMARTDFPDAYEHLLNGDSGRWRRAILTIWGRAWLYLEQTESLEGLGISDDVIEPLVTSPDLLDEIDRLRAAEGC